MAEEFLESIYKEAKLLCQLKEVVELAKVLDEHHAYMYYNRIATTLAELCQRYMKYNPSKAMELYHVAEEIAQEKSVICIGDKIEHQLIPHIEESMKQWGSIETVNDEGDYYFESTVSGFLTIKDLKKDCYLHSTVDPMWEAKKQVEYMYDPKKSSYSVLGCGLGYFIYQLYLVSRGSIVIHVYVRDSRMIEYARNYGVLDWIPEDRLHIVVYEDSLSFLQSAEEESAGFHILPYTIADEPEEMRVALNMLHGEFCTGKSFERDMDINFYRNVESDCKPITAFDTSVIKDEIIVVAAGPSLDDNMEFLRESKGKKTIVAVGTVFKKLLEAKIEPDLFVVVDPQERTYKQIEGVEDSSVPMLVAMSAYWKFAWGYKGEKYMVPIGQTFKMKQYAVDHDLAIWDCTGTVTSLAVEAAIRFQAKSIYLVGVDLAYPDGVSHATGTMDRVVHTVDRLKMVEGVHGQVVYSTDVFDVYREGVEEKIAQTPQITYYNMSRIGSRIKGTIEVAFE